MNAVGVNWTWRKIDADRWGWVAYFKCPRCKRESWEQSALGYGFVMTCSNERCGEPLAVPYCTDEPPPRAEWEQ